MNDPDPALGTHPSALLPDPVAITLCDVGYAQLGCEGSAGGMPSVDSGAATP